MAPRRADTAGTIDPRLGDLVAERWHAFSKAFEGATGQSTPATRAPLQEATDELMRTLARVMIELSRIEGDDRGGASRSSPSQRVRRRQRPEEPL
jgi:hypothetical protein